MKIENVKNLILKASFLSLLALAIWSCERDDICAEATATTPNLIIRFYDINNQDEFKSVRQLTVRGLDDFGVPGNEITLPSVSPDSIALPLRFANEDIETITRFQLEKDSDFATNGNDTNDSNIDVIEVRYTPEFVYVSRACGFKSIFNFGNTGGVSIDPDGDNWIINTDIINQTIDNENAAQVIIFH